MASPHTHHSGAPYYGAYPDHSAYGEPCRSQSSALRPNMPFVSYSPTVVAPRDTRSSTGRIRRTRPFATQNHEMHGIPPVQGTSTARHTMSHRRSTPQVWFVPDPPTWSSPGADRPAAKPEMNIDVKPEPQSSMSSDRHRRGEPRQSQSPLASAPRYKSSPGAAFGQGLPSPPPTPRITRLRTPDIKALSQCRPFCGCCSDVDRVVDSRSKIELQCKFRCRLDTRISLVQLSIG